MLCIVGGVAPPQRSAHHSSGGALFQARCSADRHYRRRRPGPTPRAVVPTPSIAMVSELRLALEASLAQKDLALEAAATESAKASAQVRAIATALRDELEKAQAAREAAVQVAVMQAQSEIGQLRATIVALRDELE